jgi:hypothetical protein
MQFFYQYFMNKNIYNEYFYELNYKTLRINSTLNYKTLRINLTLKDNFVNILFNLQEKTDHEI